MALPPSVEAQLDWAESLAFLELPAGAATLPAASSCPHCGSPAALRLYEDSINGGVWHHCRDCERSGGLAELAAAVWRCPTPAALTRLARAAGAADVASADHVATLAGRARALGLWGRAQDYARRGGSAALAALRDRLHLCVSHFSPERWRGWPARLLGGLTLADVSLHYLGTARGRDRASKLRPLPGPGWGDVLVFPYEGAPGLPAGFLFLGKHGDAAGRAWQPAYRCPGRRGRGGYEAGLYGLAAAHAGLGLCGPHCVAVADAALAARLQLRHLRGSGRPLPLVAWQDGGRGLTGPGPWRCLGGRPLVWSWGLTASALYQAVAADADLCLDGPADRDEVNVDHYLRKGPPLDLLRRVCRHARPWPEALRRWAEGAAAGAAALLLADLGRYGGGAAERVAREAGGPFQAAALPAGQRSVTHKGSRYVERGDRWYVQRPGHTVPTLLCDFVLRVDRHSGNRYEGRVLYAGRVFPFQAAGNTFTLNPVRWLRHFLAARGHTALVGKATRDLLPVANLFHPSEETPAKAPGVAQAARGRRQEAQSP